jgi:hypothetical protein
MATHRHLHEAIRLGSTLQASTTKIIDQPSLEVALHQAELLVMHLRALRGVPDDLQAA